MANPFDFDEDDAARQFEKNTIFGISSNDSSVGLAHDFMKKSLAAANMLNNEDEEEDISTITATTRTVSFSKGSAEPDGLKPLHSFSFIQAPKQTSADLIKSARHGTQNRGNHEYSGLDDVVHNKPQISAADYQKLQEELRIARQTIEAMKGEKWMNLPVKDTIQRVLVGKPYALEGYKALHEKQDLLDCAIKSRDGNAITTVVMFIEKTLKPELFLREIRKRHSAVKHYIQYLRKHGEWEQLEQFYMRMLLLEDAAYLRYETINMVKNITDRIEELNKWIQDYGLKQECSELLPYIKDEITLLKKQKEMEGEDKVRAATASDTTMKYHPRVGIERKPLLTTVTYCALYHYDKGSKHHPEPLKKTFKLTDKQYEWAVLPPRANLHRWADIQELLTSTGWFKKGEVSYMGFDQVVVVLHKAKANEEILTKYLNLISNLDLRIKYASKFSVHEIVIDAIVHQRDRRKMEEYRLKIGGTSTRHRQKINDLLNNSQIKWR